MKMLLKSHDLTASIIVSVRFRRDYWIKESNRFTLMEDITEHDRDMLLHDCNNIIHECNDVLDAIGVD